VSNFDGPDKSHYGPISDAYLQSLNREPIKMFDIVAAGDPAPASGTVRFIVPLGSQRIVTKVTVRYVPNDPALDPFPNLRDVFDMRLWMALRDRNRAGNEGHVIGVRNVLASRAAPAPIPNPFGTVADAAGLAGHSESFGGPGFIITFGIGAGFPWQQAMATGIYDEVIGELTCAPVATPPGPCPPGQIVLQTRWEPATAMDPREWSYIKSLLDPRVGNARVTAGSIE
jgi:hypothetical protein